jgi:hypothetical protein
MIAILLTFLFFAGAALAIGTIVHSVRRHGAQFRRLHGELASRAGPLQVRVTITGIEVRSSASVLRPEFGDFSLRPSLRGAGRRPQTRPALPAAA